MVSSLDSPSPKIPRIDPERSANDWIQLETNHRSENRIKNSLHGDIQSQKTKRTQIVFSIPLIYERRCHSILVYSKCKRRSPVGQFVTNRRLALFLLNVNWWTVIFSTWVNSAFTDVHINFSLRFHKFHRRLLFVLYDIYDVKNGAHSWWLFKELDVLYSCFMVIMNV